MSFKVAKRLFLFFEPTKLFTGKIRLTHGHFDYSERSIRRTISPLPPHFLPNSSPLFVLFHEVEI